MRKSSLILAAVLMLGIPEIIFAISQAKPAYAQAPASLAGNPADLPAGTYKNDPAHTSLLFRVMHFSLSHYTARFTKVAATIDFDPKNFEQSKLTATIDASSLQTDFPDPAKVDFDKELTGADWLDAATYPTMAFVSTGITKVDATHARIAGNLTLHGVTKPEVLDVTLNGAYKEHPMTRHAAMGFSARGTIKRSDFGVTKYLPMVSDEVEIVIETEFQKAD